MSVIELLDSWPVPHARAGVVGTDGVLATWGDRTRVSDWKSVTKLATALATLVAVEEGTVDLDEPAGPPGSTVRHLLAHASGLAPEERRAVAAPGIRRIYSNPGFEVVGEVVAAAAGMPFGRYLAEAVLEPLRMTETRLDGSPASGLSGSLDDMLLLAAELQRPTLVSAATMEAATAVAFPGLAGVLPGFGAHDPQDWGLGFERRDAKSPHWTGATNSAATFGHFGASGSFLWVDPDARLACAALTERTFGPWAQSAWPALSDAVVAEFGA